MATIYQTRGVGGRPVAPATGRNAGLVAAYADQPRVIAKLRRTWVAATLRQTKGQSVFLIFGLRTKAVRMGLAAGAICRVCGQSGTLLVVRESTKLSLFFIPLVPIRTKYVLHCTNPLCGNRTTVSAGEAKRLLAAGAGSLR